MRVAITNPKPKMAGVTDRGEFLRRISAEISNCVRIGVSETDYVLSLATVWEIFMVNS